MRFVQAALSWCAPWRAGLASGAVTVAVSGAAWFAIVVSPVAAHSGHADDEGQREQLREQARAIFGELPAEATSPVNPIVPNKIDLGRMLYFDPRLSKNHDVSCNSCHDLATFGQDNQPNSPGHRGQRGGRSSPTVYNAALHISQFWDGRAPDVEAQAKGPVLNPIEMAMPDEAAVLKVLRSMPGYQTAFAAAFPGESQPITYDNMALAIGAFERRLMTPSRFDDFLAGDDDALTDEEIGGLATFVQTGCVTCHMGPAVGGGMYQKLGVMKPYETKDMGRFEVTGAEAELYVFKVPSLRNIAETAPYFHDGSIETLPEAIRTMAEYQLGKDLEAADVAAIEAFLGSLTGRIDAQYTRKPKLPLSTRATPKPDPT
jgi:cytochrome c peroxidase